MIPGEYFIKAGDITANDGRDTITITVVNTGDRPIQIGAHFHFFEVNKMMQFNREQAFGRRLNIPAGNAVRFEPGEEKEVSLTRFGGKQVIVGFNNLVNGAVQDPNIKTQALEKAAALGFKTNKA
ncbi:urease subunit beta/urease subunit gamma/beta [Chitinophaga skermanii]|uniref:Urease subunit beta n=1 Tax=Chitinophaga skermanii TaxID=331697 RepID=A0A327R2J7_9BACT|nr:urease subunit beta [Chitinophaga skermanii]RAJ10900.1 urease subunit beta/urease subunit gamma/beta [Chitinophaga skermanii]